jgi:hypothetical protein
MVVSRGESFFKFLSPSGISVASSFSRLLITSALCSILSFLSLSIYRLMKVPLSLPVKPYFMASKLNFARILSHRAEVCFAYSVSAYSFGSGAIGWL